MKLTFVQRTAVTLTAFGLILLLAGCPYSSNVPVDEGTVKISQKLEGSWIKEADKDGENPSYFVLKPEDKYRMRALKLEYSTSDLKYDTTVYSFTLSDVNGETFMNLKEDGSSTYYIFKFTYDPAKDVITTDEVSDYIRESFDTSKELKDFIAKNKSLSFFYTTSSEVYVRK